MGQRRIIKGNFKYFLLNENENNSQNILQNIVLYSYKRKEEMSQINQDSTLGSYKKKSKIKAKWVKGNNKDKSKNQ